MDKLDLSTLKKVSSDFLIKQVQEHMRKFPPNVTRVEKVVSCYRLNTTAKRIYQVYPECIGAGAYEDLNRMSSLKGNIQLLYFPVLILLALIPEEEGKRLTIGEIVVSKWDVLPSWILNNVAAYGLDNIGKGRLEVEHLTVVCTSDNSFSLDNLRSELFQFGIECVKCTLKVFIDQWKDYSSELKKLQDYVRGNDELKLVFDVEDGKDVTCILPYLEDLTDIPLCREGHRESNHIMFMPSRIPQDLRRYIPSLEGPGVAELSEFTGNGILIATLGYGCDSHEPKYKIYYEKKMSVLCQKNFASETAPVYDDRYTSPWIINDYTKTSSLVVCQTTYCDGTIANGATAKAIKWLREEWKRRWLEQYDNLVILIPYGGQYMEDEMREIYGATDEGIIIVCAVGGQGGEVVFPAALGTVISVGVAGSGPRGREVDICVVPGQYKSRACGVAAAWITGLLALFLARLNSILKSPSLSNPLSRGIAQSIKRIPKYVHTCVIRELLVNEGTGSHDPQRGYGNGVEIFQNLIIGTEDGLLLSKMANILLKRHTERRKMAKLPAGSTRATTADEMREVLYHDLDGSGISVAVIDKVFDDAENSKGHGSICSDIIKDISPGANITHIKDPGNNVTGMRECCSEGNTRVSIISCSMGTETFDVNASKAVSKAVMSGKIVVFSAGNEGERFRNAIMYPARIGNVLVIGGQDPYNSHLSFSSVGRELDFLAPAVLGSHRGTSYAAPVIAGYVALLLQFIKEMSEEDYCIVAWRENIVGQYEWREISIWKAAHNVYAMRDLLKMFVAKPQEHSEKSGFGCIDFSVIFPSYRVRPDVYAKTFVAIQAKKQIKGRLQRFYCKQYWSIMLNVYSLEMLFGKLTI